MVVGYVLFEDALRVVLRLARVDRERLPEANSVLELADEDLLLNLARGVIVVVVQSHLAHPTQRGCPIAFILFRTEAYANR